MAYDGIGLKCLFRVTIESLLILWTNSFQTCTRISRYTLCYTYQNIMAINHQIQLLVSDQKNCGQPALEFPDLNFFLTQGPLTQYVIIEEGGVEQYIIIEEGGQENDDSVFCYMKVIQIDDGGGGKKLAKNDDIICEWSLIQNYFQSSNSKF